MHHQPVATERCEFDNCHAPATVATFIRVYCPALAAPGSRKDIRLFTGTIHSCWVDSLEIVNEPGIAVLAREYL